MLMLKPITAFVLLFIMLSFEVAQSKLMVETPNVCLNEADFRNRDLQKSFNNCWEPLGMSYLAFNSAIGKTENEPLARSFNHKCQADPIESRRISLNQLVNSLNEGPMSLFLQRPDIAKLNELGFSPAKEVPFMYKSNRIKRECIVASMKRNPGNKGYVCNYADDKTPIGVNPGKQSILKYYGVASGPTAQCVDDRMTDYIYFAVNSAIQCLSGSGKIDSRTVYRKINNESAFNVSVASTGGWGIAQITSSARNEMIDPELGRGRYILDQVSKSNDPSCRGFKEVASQDLLKAPSMAQDNRCAWLSPGDGLARNLMYSIGYYLTMRDKYIVPALTRMAPHLADSEKLLGELTSIAYGSEGIKHAKMLLRKFRVNSQTNADQLVSSLRGQSRYLKNIKSKMKEVTCLRKGLEADGEACKKLKLSSEDLEGDSCVAPI